MNIGWWCTALESPWTWAWVAYPAIWAAALAPLVAYHLAMRRRGESADETGRQRLWFTFGILAFWVASDWPLGTLGAGYLASAHMLQYLLYILVAAPLLLLGIPEWMARRIVERLRMYRLLKGLSSRLLLTGIIFNIVLVGSHAPVTVDLLRTSAIGSFAMDFLWLASGLLLWLPLAAPLPELRNPSYPARMVYLFAATGIVAILPASFLTFSVFPLYRIYELAPRVNGIAAIDDQQMAGLIMKLGMLPVIWSVLAVQWFRWANTEPALRVRT
ncbi:MAG: cytochrome c oxidase assembly protein [Acidimicrobiia bacterium]|nr:cytochrome c oxidase assembly protein [Acidimicrobiia bacterium]